MCMPRLRKKLTTDFFFQSFFYIKIHSPNIRKEIVLFQKKKYIRKQIVHKPILGFLKIQ